MIYAMFKHVFNFIVYLCCGGREEPEQKSKNIISEEYNELLDYLKRQRKIYKSYSTCCWKDGSRYDYNFLVYSVGILQLPDLTVNCLDLLALFQTHLLNQGEFGNRKFFKYSLTLYIMLNNIRKFISDMFHHIRHMFHHTHCESDCGIAACQCENEVGSSTSTSS